MIRISLQEWQYDNWHDKRIVAEVTNDDESGLVSVRTYNHDGPSGSLGYHANMESVLRLIGALCHQACDHNYRLVMRTDNDTRYWLDGMWRAG